MKPPEHCKTCLRLLGDKRCRVMTQFMPDPCFARIDEPEKVTKIEKAVRSYSHPKVMWEKLDFTPPKADEEPVEAEETVEVDSGPMSYRDIVFMEVARKGTSIEVPVVEERNSLAFVPSKGRGGGGEKEKAGHKKNKGTKIYVEPWSGFD